MSGILSFNWGVFWAVLAALGVGYLLVCFLARAVPTRNLIAEARLQAIADKLDALDNHIELSGTETWLTEILTLLEYWLGVTPKEAHDMNIERKIAEDDEAYRIAAEEKPHKNKNEPQS
jgi:hypothetical protein